MGVLFLLRGLVAVGARVAYLGSFDLLPENLVENFVELVGLGHQAHKLRKYLRLQPGAGLAKSRTQTWRWL